LEVSLPAGFAPDGKARTFKFTTTASEAPMRTLGDFAPVPASVTNAQIGMNRFRSDSRFLGIDGRGFSTVIIDTGVDRDSSFFGADNDRNGIADRIVYQYDFADNDFDASDDIPAGISGSGHGSNVTSIVASQDATYTGMAPGANIIHLKVFSSKDGSASFKYTEKALQWVGDNIAKYNIASVNMSLGDTVDTDGDNIVDASGNHGTAQSLYGLGEELEWLANAGVIVVSAAGNSFYEHQSVPGVAYPASDPNSLAVGAVYNIGGGQFSWGNRQSTIDFTSGIDRSTSFSQRHGTLTDIFAPGAMITGVNPSGGLVTMGGTSQASPHIAGIAVLAQQLAVKELGRRLSFNEFRDLLNSTGKPIIDGDDENDNVTNTGIAFRRVDVVALAEGILAMKPNTAPTLSTNAIAMQRGGTAAIGNPFVSATDAQQSSSQLLYTLTSAPQDGQVTLNGSPLAVGSIFTQADIDNNRLIPI
jgi:hypothetical protein